MSCSLDVLGIKPLASVVPSTFPLAHVTRFTAWTGRKEQNVFTGRERQASVSKCRFSYFLKKKIRKTNKKKCFWWFFWVLCWRSVAVQCLSIGEHWRATATCCRNPDQSDQWPAPLFLIKPLIYIKHLLLCSSAVERRRCVRPRSTGFNKRLSLPFNSLNVWNQPRKCTK